MEHNRNCFIVTGRPRTPRDQGSVESANKLVQRVLKSISSERRLQSLEVNWTNLLGQVMSVCNSHSGRKKYDVSSYEAVFGQRYHPQLKCNLEDMRKCRSIYQRLKLSPDERLEKYVRESNIVDIEFDNDVIAAAADVMDDDDITNDDDEDEGQEIDDNAFPECEAVNNEEDKDEEENFEVLRPSEDVGITIQDINPPVANIGTNSQPTQNETQTEIQLCGVIEPTTLTHPSNDEATLPTFRSSYFSEFKLDEAWNHGNIARSQRPLSSSGRREYKFLMPTLNCTDCCFHTGRYCMTVGDDTYIESIRTTTNWYDGDFIGSFAQLASHYAHVTYNERNSVSENIDMPMVIHVTFPRQQLEVGHYKALPDGVTRVVAIMHDADHYAVLEITVPTKRIVIYDGLSRDLIGWIDHVVSAMKRCMLVTLDAECHSVGDDPTLVPLRHRQRKNAIQGYSLTFGSDNWRFEKGEFVKQVDSFNCGPIACTKILEMFKLVTEYEVKIAYHTNALRTLVTNEWKRFVTRFNDNLIVRVRERIPLRTPVAGDGDLVLPLRNSGLLRATIDPVIAAAAAASAEAPMDTAQLCFCCCDSPNMDLVIIPCCKQFIHRQCLLAHLGVSSQCCYCRRAITDIATVLQYRTVDRSQPLPSTRNYDSPLKRSPGKKRDLQQLEFEASTPMRIADEVRSASQEKKRKNQLQQANRMMRTQGKDVENQGGGTGAVVTVKPDYRAVSHNIGIVGVIYEMKSTGGARIATVAGMLSSGTTKGNWWIPSDQYVVNYKPHEVANIPPKLEEIRQAILSGEYNKNNDATKCTIQEAHQVITQAISPCRKAKCGCSKGNCKKGRCGCISKGFKCTSACSCNGNCTANANNDK